MSYAAEEVSQQDGNPVLLFTFARGSQVWRYTTRSTVFTNHVYEYTPEVITTSPFMRSGEVPKDSLQVMLPITNPMAAAFLSYSPNAVTTVTVFRTSNTDVVGGEIVFKGRVLSSSTTVATVTLNCENVFTSMRRMGLRQTYQRYCRHMLFGPGCNVDPAAFATSVTITGVVGSTVTLYGPLDDIYLGGNIKASDGTLMMIVEKPSGNVLTLMRPVIQLLSDMATYPTGFTATVYRGCDKSTATCRGVFNNIGNFGGFPGITGINPFSGSSNVF